MWYGGDPCMNEKEKEIDPMPAMPGAGGTCMVQAPNHSFPGSVFSPAEEERFCNGK